MREKWGRRLAQKGNCGEKSWSPFLLDQWGSRVSISLYTVPAPLGQAGGEKAQFRPGIAAFQRVGLCLGPPGLPQAWDKAPPVFRWAGGSPRPGDGPSSLLSAHPGRSPAVPNLSDRFHHKPFSLDHLTGGRGGGEDLSRRGHPTNTWRVTTPRNHRSPRAVARRRPLSSPQFRGSSGVPWGPAAGPEFGQARPAQRAPQGIEAGARRKRDRALSPRSVCTAGEVPTPRVRALLPPRTVLNSFFALPYSLLN